MTLAHLVAILLIGVGLQSLAISALIDQWRDSALLCQRAEEARDNLASKVAKLEAELAEARYRPRRAPKWAAPTVPLALPAGPSGDAQLRAHARLAQIRAPLDCVTGWPEPPPPEVVTLRPEAVRTDPIPVIPITTSEHHAIDPRVVLATGFAAALNRLPRPHWPGNPPLEATHA